MRYLVGFVFVLALVASPLGVSAQDHEEGATSGPKEPAPSSEPAPEEPALQLKLDYAGVGVAPGYPPRFDELELRVKRAKIGFGASAGVFLAGFVTGVIYLVAAEPFAICLFDCPPPPEWVDRISWASTALLLAGFVGMITVGGIVGHRKRKLRELKEAHYGTPPRVRWDLARSRLVF
jgi:hypothetical protein